MKPICQKATTYSLFFFNHLFFVLGAMLMGSGLWLLFDKRNFITILQISTSTMYIVPYTLIGVGAVTMVMGFLGCVGAFSGSRCFLGLYFLGLLLLLVAQATTFLLIYHRAKAMKEKTPTFVLHLIRYYDLRHETNRSAMLAWDYFQSKMSCCGWIGPENWKLNLFLQQRNYTLYPCSCGVNATSSDAAIGFCPLAAPSDAFDSWPVRKTGCVVSARKWFQENNEVIIGVCAAVSLTEVLGMVLSVCLCKSKAL
ncbi:CD82 antigen-like [Podarcis raffonei]|uniref:CD82 antigen-like n=1 Tax=Podarcis raffonei TaxID=65483 RepID=UPI00232952F4|nr:CD82 antigen-like [Podarcis raffonei]